MKNVDVAVIGGCFGSPKRDQKGDGSQFLLRETKKVPPK